VIVRKMPNGDLLLITQTEHSRLVGQFAAHWGNATFATPKPYESVVRAAIFHDFGWLRYETAPLFDAEKGETPGFRDVPTGETRLAEYAWCTDWLLAGDPYASLIVNMHRTGLWRSRYGKIAHPTYYTSPPTLKPEIKAFADQAEARQERERAAFDEHEVWTNYRLLQVWDLLGLYFCCAEPVSDYIEPCPIGYGGDSGVRLSLTPAGPGQVAFAPFPFNERPCRVQVTGKRLPQSRYSDRDAFQRAWLQAPTTLMEFELV
jgi:hypothetical protein